MPAGVSWSKYLRFGFAAMLSMMAGAQCVHAIYRPMDDMSQLIDQYYREHPEVEQRTTNDPYQEAIEINIKKKLLKEDKKQS